MAKINLTEEEISKVVECLENQTEVPEYILAKLSPSFYEKIRELGKFDFKGLDKMKIPTLEYAGKRSEAVILAQAAITGGAAPLQIVRSFANGKNGDWKNLIVQGDNLQFLKTCYMNKDPLIKDKVKGKVKLFYNDPPFGTGDEYSGKDGEMSYSARLMGAEYIESLRERLIYCRELLSDDGSIFLRIDYHFGHYAKIIMDEVFGKENFLNEIIINRTNKQWEGVTRFNSATDSLFFYSKSQNYYFKTIYKKRDKEPSWINAHSPGIRYPRERRYKGKIYIPPEGRHWTFNQETMDKYINENRIRDKEGTLQYLQSENEVCTSNWTDIPGYSSTTRYPTENSESVLERVLKSSSEEGDLVMDIFGGSGTTAAVAEKLGRRWIVSDFGKHSIYTMQKRILNIAESKELETDKKKKYGKPPKPFCVVSAGAYDFGKIMNLRKNKDAYILFVLGLFNIRQEKKDYTKKYKINNIFAEKDNNPVEIYPVWDDEYLNNIRIDNEYLNDIIKASGGKIKGDYYIITPENCTVVNDIILRNDNNEKVNFKFLKFPYKVFEEFARQFEIQEQPSSQSDINKLISSTALYFNQEVTVKTKRVNEGIKITDFKTNILNSKKEKFKDADGLALVLIDKNYDGKIFEMDMAVYAKDIKDNIIKIDDLTDNTFLIAIDKHGNESKPVKV